MKKCLTCNQEKEPKEFHKDSSRTDGLCPTCKVCRSASRKSAIAASKIGNTCLECAVSIEHLQVNARFCNAKCAGKYYRANTVLTPEQKRHKADYVAAWQRANADKCREADKRYYYRNKEKRNADKAVWRKVNPEKSRIQGSNYRASIKQVYSDMPDNFWFHMLRYYKSCQKCGSLENLQHDHVVPVSLNGDHTLLNAQVLCASCNQIKSNKSSADYRTRILAWTHVT